LFNGVSLASRFFGGTNWGVDAQKFRLGSIPWIFSSDVNRNYPLEISAEEVYFSEYIMPLRGFPISNKLGQNVLLGNLELRLPFLIYYFPTIKYIGQINGVLFTDFGVAWDNKYPKFWDECSWESSDAHENYVLDEDGYLQKECKDYDQNTGWLMSYGFGPRFIFLGFPWKLDFAWQYNPHPHKGTTFERKWYLSIGLDF